MRVNGGQPVGAGVDQRQYLDGRIQGAHVEITADSVYFRLIRQLASEQGHI